MPNDSTKLFLMSFTALLLEKRSIKLSRNCNRTLMHGCGNTTTAEPIRENAA